MEHTSGDIRAQSGDVMSPDQQAVVAPGVWRRAQLRLSSVWWPFGSWSILFALLLVVFLLNVGTGSVRIDPATVLSVIAGRLGDALMTVPLLSQWVSGVASLLERMGLGDEISFLQRSILVDASPRDESVIWYIRLPRTLLGATVGAGLAICGATLQGIFRNPLADPGIIGVSAGASVGAVAAIVLGISWFGIWTLPVFAFLAASVVTAVVYAIARREGHTEVVTLILAGVAVSSLAGGMVGWLTTIADDAQLRSISFWQMGSLGGAQWSYVGVVSVFVAIGGFWLGRTANALNLMTLGEREARHLGVRVERMRGIAMILTAAITGAAVSFAGAIGFVGLVVPHLVRLIWGPDHRQLLPRSVAVGAIVLMLADLVSRLVIEPMELPVGVVMGMVGGPFFGWLLIRTRRQQGGWA